jgi:hypothetical protein
VVVYYPLQGKISGRYPFYPPFPMVIKTSTIKPMIGDAFVAVTSLVKKFAIVANLCFIKNIMYYREVRYHISTKGNSSFNWTF